MKSRRGLLATLGLLAIAGVTIALIVVVAGGRGDEAPTPATYLAQINAICGEYGARLDRIPPPGDLSSPGAVVESLEQALPVLEAQRLEVGALPAPAALRTDLAAFLALTDRSLTALRAALDAALERALYPMATALTRFGERRDEAKVIAGRLGFDC